MKLNDILACIAVIFRLCTLGLVCTVFGVAAFGQSSVTVAGILPVIGPVGTPVTISGSGFGNAPGTLTFNGTGATTITSWTDTLIEATVPTGASTGNVVVTANGVTSNTGVIFSIPTPNFAITGTLANARSSQTATLLENGNVLVAAGYGGGLQTRPWGSPATASAELYSPVTGSFTTTGNLNAARISSTATLLDSGSVLVAGGTDGRRIRVGVNSAATSTELYDPASGTFAFSGSMSTARFDHSATLLSNGNVLIAGGTGTTINTLSSAELYNPSTGTFTTTGGLNDGRTSHTATLLPNGKVLIVGGSDSNDYASASAELYDPVAGTFTVTGSLSIGRINHTATLLNNGLVLVAGGFDYNSDALASAELYNPATGTFTLTGSLNIGRGEHTATPLNNGLILLAGGFDINGNTLASAELYDPVAGTFTVTGTMNSTRLNFTASLLNNGQVLLGDCPELR